MIQHSLFKPNLISKRLIAAMSSTSSGTFGNGQDEFW